MHVAFTWLSIRRVVKVGLVLGLAYGWWVTSRFDEVHAVNQQELASAGTELKRAIENAMDTVENYKLPEQTANSDPGAASEASNPLCVFDRNQPFIELVQVCTAVNGPFQQLQLTVDGGFVTIGANAQKGGKVSWRFRADTVLTDLTLTDTFPFVFLADAQGKVLYQATPAQRRWQRLLRWGDLQFRDSAAGDTPGARIQDLTKVVNANWGNLQAVTGRTAVTVGGEWYQLYTQPVSTGPRSGPGLVLGALIPSRDVARQAFAIDSYFMAFLVVALLLGALGVPFVKLASMSAHERFRMRDVYWLYVSCASLLMLATFTVYGVDAYARWLRVSEDGLAETATHLAGQIANEVSDLRTAVARHDETAAAQLQFRHCTIPGPIVDWFEAERADPSLRGGEDAAAGLPFSGPAATGHLSDWFKIDTNVFIRQQTWIDRSGQQIWKVSADKSAKYTEVGDRPYFQAVVNDHLYGSSSGPGLFYIAPDRSITDGKFYTFLAMRSKLTGLNCEDDPEKGEVRVSPLEGPYVTVATGWLLSVDHVALPTGYSFALINRDGRVLYHSDARLSLRENLFAQLSDGDEARAIVHAGASRALRTQYRGAPHRMQFEPLPWQLANGLSGVELSQTSAGLWLVAFRDVSMGRAIIARVFVVSLLSAMVVLLLGIAVALRLTGVVSQRREGGPSRWLWPHAARVPVYRRQAWAYGAVILAFVSVSLWTGSNAVYLLLPVATATAGLVIYAGDRRRLLPRAPLLKWTAYATQFLLLVMGMVLIPAFALFNLTVEHEFGRLIRAEQKTMSQGTEDAVRILKARSRSEGYPAATSDRIARAHLMRGGVRWPAPYNAEPEPAGPLDRMFLRAHEQLDRLLPFDNNLTAPQKYLDGSEGYAIPGRMGTLGMLGLLAILYALFRWIRWSAVRLHYADAVAHSPLPDEDAAERWVSLDDTDKFVLMQIAAEGIANPYQRPTVLDLMKRGLLSLEPDLQPSSPTMAKIVQRANQDVGWRTRLTEWERKHEGQNWQQVRTVLVASLVLVALFLVITQPALQSQVVGIAGAIGALIASAGKLRDAVVGWLPFAPNAAKTKAP